MPFSFPYGTALSPLSIRLYLYIFIFLLLCISLIRVSAQTIPLKPSTALTGQLQTGQEIPATPIAQMLNYKQSCAKLTDFNDRLLILDFWATWCGTCLEAMPNTAALNREFAGRLMILPVTSEPRVTVDAAFRRLDYLQGLTLPMVAGDKVLQQLFPHRFLPHLIWIKNGVFLGTTDGEYLQSKNIRDVLENGRFSLQQKQDLLTYNEKQPMTTLASNPQLPGLTMLVNASLTRYLPGLPLKAGHITDTTAGTHRFYLINHSILHLYAIALGSGLSMTLNRRILEVPDPQLYSSEGQDAYHDWAREHCYCFEVTAPLDIPVTRLKAGLKTSLDSWFGLNGRIEKRETNCWALQLSDSARLVTRFAKTDVNWKPLSKVSYMHHVRTTDLVYALNQTLGMLPVVDETHTDLRFDLTTTHYPQSFEDWAAILKGSGFRLVPVKRTLDLFILSPATPH